MRSIRQIRRLIDKMAGQADIIRANITLDEADTKIKDLDARLKKIETTKADEAKVNVILSPKPTWLVG